MSITNTTDLGGAVHTLLKLVGIQAIEHVVTEQTASSFQGIATDRPGESERVDVRVLERARGSCCVWISGDQSQPVVGESSYGLRDALLKAALRWERRSKSVAQIGDTASAAITPPSKA